MATIIAQPLARPELNLATERSHSPYPRVGTLQRFVLVGFCCAFGTDLFQVMFSGNAGSAAAAERSPAVYVAFLITYFTVFIFCLKSFRQITIALMAYPLMALLLCYPFLSILWSQAPAITLQRSVAVAGCSLFGLYLGSVFPLRDLIRLLANAASLMAIVHVLVSLLLPSVGVMDASWEATGVYAGAWRGLTPHKNMLGAYSSMHALVLLFAILTFKDRMRWLYIAGFFLSMLSLYEARSTTAILILFMCVFIILVMKICQIFPNLAWTSILICLVFLPLICLSVFTDNFLADLFAMLDKNPQMSGRFPLWDLAISRVNERFWLGYGHEVFWDPDDLYVRYIAEKLRYSPHYSHNGAIETLLNGGFLLLLLLFFSYLASIYKSVRLVIKNPDKTIVILPLCFLVLFLLANLTESHVLARNNLIWALFVAMSFAALLELKNPMPCKRS